MRVLLVDDKSPVGAVPPFGGDLSALNVERVTSIEEAAALVAAASDVALVLVDWTVWHARREKDPQSNFGTLFPEIPVLVIFDALDAMEGERALAAGAKHYLARTAEATDLRATLKRLLPSPAPQGDAVQGEVAGAPSGITDGLTAREKEVVALLLGGRSNKEIGRELSVSDGTIKAHLHNIMRKMEVRNRIELVHKMRGWKL